MLIFFVFIINIYITHRQYLNKIIHSFSLSILVRLMSTPRYCSLGFIMILHCGLKSVSLKLLILRNTHQKLCLIQDLLRHETNSKDYISIKSPIQFLFEWVAFKPQIVCQRNANKSVHLVMMQGESFCVGNMHTKKDRKFIN